MRRSRDPGGWGGVESVSPGSLKRWVFVPLAALALFGCGKDENSPDMGAVPPKPDPGIKANAPGGAGSPATPGADAAALGPRGS